MRLASLSSSSQLAVDAVRRIVIRTLGASAPRMERAVLQALRMSATQRDGIPPRSSLRASS
jgi:hypothetical protein